MASACVPPPRRLWLQAENELVLEEQQSIRCWGRNRLRYPQAYQVAPVLQASRTGACGTQGGCPCSVQIHVLMLSILGFRLKALRLCLLDVISCIRAPRCEFFIMFIIQRDEQIEAPPPSPVPFLETAPLFVCSLMVLGTPLQSYPASVSVS